MLLIFEKQENLIPMHIINVHTGELKMKINFVNQDPSGEPMALEFLEQFNESLLLKRERNTTLRI